jgi:maleate cis-trans isomerase
MMQRRVGVLVPSSNAVVEPELLRLLPSDTTLHVARVGSGGDLDTALGAMAADLVPEARKLAQVEPHAVAFACTSGSFYDGDRSDAELCAEIADAAHAPATTATTAAIWSLRELGASRIVFCSPYTPDVHARGVARFADAGFDVVTGECLGFTTNAEIGAVEPEEICALVRQSWTPGADAVFLSCTGLRTAGVLDPLAAELGSPVLSSNGVLARHVVALAAALPEPASL